MSSQDKPKTIYLSDYTPTPYQIEQVDLHFVLDESQTRVRSRIRVRRNNTAPADAPLALHGEALELVSVAVDERVLAATDYKLTEDALVLEQLPEAFELQIETLINPGANTELSGLYTSSGNFCSQCEAEGFRRITYMYDRPDVMTRYRTTIVADKTLYPVLLSNGNCIARGLLEGDDQRHWVTWEDPFPKPTYLFALVAGDLACIEDSFTTMSGRKVDLHIFVEHHNKDECDHAMRSLKKSMLWDEQVYGREYDLDVYMIVAVDDFNMGAMENKGLNVFNSKYVLAKPDTATDNDYLGIESVIGHEYFHNWSGNRVTCRDWFQLSLKEGFTVFRDQEFSADMGSRGVKRIDDVNALRNVQFREDAGPMAHPVRPESYVEINNFYTSTVYNKGAEVVRMLHHLLGAENFRKGTDLYFARHDGQAVTTDDFVKALEDANDMDFTQFKRWYSQAGTPVLEVQGRFDAANHQYTLTVEQSCPPTPGQEQKQPFYIPLAIGLVGANGEDLAFRLDGESKSIKGTQVLHVCETRQEFALSDVKQQPVPSLLRGFSAPVKVNAGLSDDELCFLMAHDSDDFNRWDAGQRLAVKIIRELAEAIDAGKTKMVPESYLQAIANILRDSSLDKSLAAQAVSLPSENYVAEFVSEINPGLIHQARRYLRKSMAQALQQQWLEVYQDNSDDGGYQLDALSMGRRALKNTCLSYLSELEDEQAAERCYRQYSSANNMTDVIAALGCLVNMDCAQRATALAQFYDKWQNDVLVVDKWFSLQASSRLPDTLSRVKELAQHPAFSLKNPNRIRALLGAFVFGNAAQFHAEHGQGYVMLTDFLRQIDALNPQIASRLVSAYSMWRRYAQPMQGLMQQQLESILEFENLSKDVYEIASKSLGKQ